MTDPYADEKFWNKVTKTFSKAGKSLLEKALQLYYTLKEPGTPTWAKTVITGALAYFISPLDAIPDVTPAAGFVDDIGIISLALVTVAAYINDNVRKKAAEKLKQWFP